MKAPVVISFPTDRAGRPFMLRPPGRSESAVIIILPIVRIERYDEPPHTQPPRRRRAQHQS